MRLYIAVLLILLAPSCSDTKGRRKQAALRLREEGISGREATRKSRSHDREKDIKRLQKEMSGRSKTSNTQKKPTGKQSQERE